MIQPHVQCLYRDWALCLKLHNWTTSQLPLFGPFAFDLLRPDIESKVVQKQAVQKTQHDICTKQRQFTIGQAVMVKNLRPRGEQWIPGVIVHQSGPVTYHVDVVEGKVWKRHQDHLKFRDLPDPEADLVSPQAESDLDVPFQLLFLLLCLIMELQNPLLLLYQFHQVQKEIPRQKQAQVVDIL